jgi:putative oxidoreductase
MRRLVLRFNHPAVPFLGRLLIIYIFLTSGISKVTAWDNNVAYMSTRHLPAVPLLLAVAAIIELGGSICIAIGYHARIAAFVMFLYTAALTVMFHNYWSFTGQLAGTQETHFRKNLAIMGGLLILAYSGPGAWSIRAADRTSQ